jgi:membrane protein involved in colicin uptake
MEATAMVSRSNRLTAATRAVLVSRVSPVMFRHPEGEGDPPADPPADPPEPELGDAGKRAIAAERERAKAAEKAAREATKRAEEAEQRAAEALKKGQTDEDRLVDEKVAAKVAEAESAAAEKVAAAERRVKVATLKAAAAGRLADPGDAAAFIDVDDLNADDDAAVSAAIDDLLERKPHLAAVRKGGGSADQGYRDPAKPDFKNREHLQAGVRALGVRLRT